MLAGFHNFQETRTQASRPAEVPIKSLQWLYNYKLNLGNLGFPIIPRSPKQIPNMYAQILQLKFGKSQFGKFWKKRYSCQNHSNLEFPYKNPILFSGKTSNRGPIGKWLRSQEAKRNKAKAAFSSNGRRKTSGRILVSIVARSNKTDPPKKGNTAMKIYDNGECNFDHLIFGGM